MLVYKGGITRNINADRLHEYTKGYAPVAAAQAAPAAPKGDRQPKKKDKAKE